MKEIEFIGDVHLGRKFSNGVPLHRRGHREEMVWEDFKKKVMSPEAEIICQVGDLFNEFSVSEALVLQTFELVAKAAVANESTMYIFIMGNHDGSRDADKKSSFEVFQALCAALDLDNLWVLTEPTIYEGYGFIPWHPFKSSTELAKELEAKMDQEEVTTLKAVVGHWEVQSFGGEDFNLIPINVLKKLTGTVVTGHIHLPQELTIDGIKVMVTGSMQPYAHGEDPGKGWYLTISYPELLETLAGTPDTFEFTNVRVLVNDGDLIPEFNCLSCTTKRVEEKPDLEEGEIEEVALEDFDILQLFDQCMVEAGVGSQVQEKIMNKFKEMKHA